MSFSSRLKDDICRINISDTCCIISELIAIIRVNGFLTFRPENKNIRITTENASLARRIFVIAKEILGINPEISIRKARKLKKQNVYIILLPKERVFADVVKKIYSNEKEQDIRQLADKDCCKRAYLRGAFLGGGSISNPERTYHLEIIAYSEKVAQEIMDVMHNFDFNAKLIKRKNNYVVYIKEGENIADFLKAIGAHTALIKFENTRIVKEMRNNVNRVVNCETANLEKTVNASMRQIEKIKRIKESMGFEKLSRGLREIAELRLEYAEASLKELGEMLDPPVSKSGVNHRLRKLEKIADQLG